MPHQKKLAILLAGLSSLLRADATLRYHTDVQVAPVIPKASIDQAISAMLDMTLRIKGNKTYSSQGNLISITDLTTQNLTLMDAAHKRFATVPANQYFQMLGAVPATPEQMRAAMATMKTHLESRDTGRSTVIQGIQAEEHEFVLTIEMPVSTSPAPAGPMMRMLTQVWYPKPEEVQRVPALRELQDYTATATSANNPIEMISQILKGLPGLGENAVAMVEEMTKRGTTVLRMHMEFSSPILALMSQQLGPQMPAGLDANGPLVQMNQEVVELSTDPLDDALFQVPQDYQAAPLEEILKGAVSAVAPPQFKQ